MEQKNAVNHLSMRDYFAAAALTGILANPQQAMGGTTPAAMAYAYADTMIERRRELGEV